MDIDILEAHWTASELELLADADTMANSDWLLSIHLDDDAVFE